MADAKGPVFNPIDDLKALMLFFVVLWMLWLINGGPAKYEESQKPFLKQPTDEDHILRDPYIGEQYGSIPSVNVDTQRDGSLGLSKIEPSIKEQVSYKTSEKPITYLSKGISDSSGTDSRLKRSYLKIDFPLSDKASLKITGFSISNFFGKSILIGRASNLPYQGKINEETDIFVGFKSAVFLIEGQSPIGVSFRVNKCMGYLAQFQDFYPPLPPIYPSLRTSQDLTYNNCVAAHKDDFDFYYNDWRIYLKAEDKVWAERGDILRLKDDLGRTLTSIFY